MVYSRSAHQEWVILVSEVVNVLDKRNLDENVILKIDIKKAFATSD